MSDLTRDSTPCMHPLAPPLALPNHFALLALNSPLTSSSPAALLGFQTSLPCSLQKSPHLILPSLPLALQKLGAELCDRHRAAMPRQGEVTRPAVAQYNGRQVDGLAVSVGSSQILCRKVNGRGRMNK